jgi:hypothetical protein
MAAADVRGARSEVERRYDRVAAAYDLFDAPMDWMDGIDQRR